MDQHLFEHDSDYTVTCALSSTRYRRMVSTLREIAMTWKLSDDYIYMARNMALRFHAATGSKKQVIPDKVVTILCIWMTCKYCMVTLCPSIADVRESLGMGAYTKEVLFKYELNILAVIEYRVCYPGGADVVVDASGLLMDDDEVRGSLRELAHDTLNYYPGRSLPISPRVYFFSLLRNVLVFKWSDLYRNK